MSTSLSTGPWRIAYGSEIGTSHRDSALPCQDRSICDRWRDAQGSETFVGVVADGAGSAKHSAIGAQHVCQAIINAFRAHFDAGKGATELSREVVDEMILCVRAELDDLAREEQSRIREFATTVIAAFISPNASVFFQIGDGAIVIADSKSETGFRCVFWPDRGEYANTTSFVTDESVLDHLVYESTTSHVDEIAMFSDGIQGLALNYGLRNAPTAFFEAMLRPLRAQVDQNGVLAKMSESLARFLESPRVNERTDDDKTLILATRRIA